MDFAILLSSQEFTGFDLNFLISTAAFSSGLSTSGTLCQLQNVQLILKSNLQIFLKIYVTPQIAAILQNCLVHNR